MGVNLQEESLSQRKESVDGRIVVNVSTMFRM